MQKTIIINAHVISPGVDIEGASVVVENGRITKVTKAKLAAKASANVTIVDVKGQYVMPGFIDVHTHGALTCDFCDADPKALFEIAKAKLQEGVTTFLPTTLTVSHEELLVAARNAKNYVESGSPYAKVPGIHLEGPFINVKCCGGLATRRRSMRNDPFHPASTLQCTQSPYGAERLPPTDGHPTTIIVLMSSFVNMAKPIFNIRLTDYGVRVSVLSALHPPTKPLPDAVPSTLLGFRAGSFPCCLRLPRAWATISIATLR